MTCREVVPGLGAYVLGALEAEETRQVEEHLQGCGACRAEVAELEALPGLLARADPRGLRGAPVAPSPDLFDRVSAAAGGFPRRPRHGRRLLVAAAAALVVGGIAVGVTARQESRVPGTVWASAGQVQMTITATARSDGTALDVTVAGLSRNEQCRLVVIDRDGRRHPAGEWAATYAGAAWFRGWTEVDRGALAEVVLLDRRGHELVRADL